MTPRCCGCCAAVRWRGCDARSSRWSRRRWAASCRRGMAWAVTGRSDRLAEVIAQLEGARCRRASSSATSCRRGSAATSPACSTSSARRGRWPGWVRAVPGAGRRAHRPLTATVSGWPCCSPGREERAGTTAPERPRLAARGVAAAPRCPRCVVLSGSARRGAGAARRSAPDRAHRARAAGRALGTRSGPARSTTTRSCRCARCAGRAGTRDRRHSAGRQRTGRAWDRPRAPGAGRWCPIPCARCAAAWAAWQRRPNSARHSPPRCWTATGW